MKTGIDLIIEERKEQIEKHGWTHEHDDDEHSAGQLAYAAAQCASPEIIYQKEELKGAINFDILDYWTWELPTKHHGNVLKDNFDCSNKQRIHQLKVAGALCAAEIDRINRLI